MNSDFKYQQIIENKPNYLDPLVWRTGLDPYDNPKGPDRKVGYGVQNTTDDYIFRKALPIDLSVDYDLKFYTKKIERNLKKYDFIPNDTCCPLVSARVVDKLQELCPDEFQAIPAKIGNEDKLTGEYIVFNIECYLINLLKAVDCIDRDKSTCYIMSNPPGAICDVKKLFFLPNCMQNYKMARDKELNTLVIVSPEFANIFTTPSYYGGFFMTPEENYNSTYNGNYWEKKA